jgi:hypothetical protein
VVFKLAQPPQGPRRRMTARAVAKELGLSTDTVMAALADLNEYAQSPASKLEELVIRRLYEALGGHYEPEKPKPTPEWQRQGRGHEGAVMVKSPGDRGALDQSSWHSRPRDDWWETRGDAAPAWEVASWKCSDSLRLNGTPGSQMGSDLARRRTPSRFEMLGFACRLDGRGQRLDSAQAAAGGRSARRCCAAVENIR